MIFFAGVGGDELVFSDGEVKHIGQVIGIIVAENQPLAQRAAKAVKVAYEDLPSIITIEVICIYYCAIFQFVLHMHAYNYYN